MPHAPEGRECCWSRLSGIKLMPEWVKGMGWRTRVLGERHPAPCSMCHSGERGWWAGGVLLTMHPKGCMWGSREEHLVQKEGREMERAPPHHWSGAVLPDSYFLHDCWGHILNVFLQRRAGSSLCLAISSPCHELALSSTCAHLHRKGEYAQLRWNTALSWDSANVTWLELLWESDSLSHAQWYVCNCFLTSLYLQDHEIN